MAAPARTLLAGRYELEGLLGRGGMAFVYRGTDRVLGRPVAIKVLSPGLAGDPGAVQRFRREAQAAAGLSHPGIVTVFDTGSEGEVHYIVMELVEGRSLSEILAERGRLRPETAAAVAARVAHALAYAHEAAVVHRDVKPGNIMVSEGRVKVMDFGIARVLSSHTLTDTAAILGTASYLSPEQAQGRSVDARTDVYALGVVLYQMLTGRTPFVGDSPVAVAVKHVGEAPIPPSEIEPAVPRDLDAEVMRALAKDPSERHATATELAARLAAIRDGLVAGAPADPSAPLNGGDDAPPVADADEETELEAGSRRRWTRLAALAVVLVAGIVSIASVFPQGSATREPAGEERTVPSEPGDRRETRADHEADDLASASTATSAPESTRASGRRDRRRAAEQASRSSDPAPDGGENGNEPPPSPEPKPTVEPTEEPTVDPSPSPVPSPTEPAGSGSKGSLGEL